MKSNQRASKSATYARPPILQCLSIHFHELFSTQMLLFGPRIPRILPKRKPASKLSSSSSSSSAAAYYQSLSTVLLPSDLAHTYRPISMCFYHFESGAPLVVDLDSNTVFASIHDWMMSWDIPVSNISVLENVFFIALAHVLPRRRQQQNQEKGASERDQDEESLEYVSLRDLFSAVGSGAARSVSIVSGCKKRIAKSAMKARDVAAIVAQSPVYMTYLLTNVWNRSEVSRKSKRRRNEIGNAWHADWNLEFSLSLPAASKAASKSKKSVPKRKAALRNAKKASRKRTIDTAKFDEDEANDDGDNNDGVGGADAVAISLEKFGRLTAILDGELPSEFGFLDAERSIAVSALEWAEVASGFGSSEDVSSAENISDLSDFSALRQLVKRHESLRISAASKNKVGYDVDGTRQISDTRKKQSMEDRMAVAKILWDSSEGPGAVGTILAVADGHGGSTCADFIMRRIPGIIQQDVLQHPCDYLLMDCGSSKEGLATEELAQACEKATEAVKSRICAALETVDNDYISETRRICESLRCGNGGNGNASSTPVSSDLGVSEEASVVSLNGNPGGSGMLTHMSFGSRKLFMRQGKPHLQDDGSTFCMALVVGSLILTLHVGDSRLVVLTDAEVVHATHDHYWGRADCFENAFWANGQFVTHSTGTKKSLKPKEYEDVLLAHNDRILDVPFAERATLETHERFAFRDCGISVKSSDSEYRQAAESLHLDPTKRLSVARSFGDFLFKLLPNRRMMLAEPDIGVVGVLRCGEARVFGDKSYTADSAAAEMLFSKLQTPPSLSVGTEGISCAAEDAETPSKTDGSGDLDLLHTDIRHDSPSFSPSSSASSTVSASSAVEAADASEEALCRESGPPESDAVEVVDEAPTQSAQTEIKEEDRVLLEMLAKLPKNELRSLRRGREIREFLMVIASDGLWAYLPSIEKTSKHSVDQENMYVLNKSKDHGLFQLAKRTPEERVGLLETFAHFLCERNFNKTSRRFDDVSVIIAHGLKSS
eukprot:ANDGO_05700.mRNA.1 hypothetical protein